jgi:hypothetical protein
VKVLEDAPDDVAVRAGRHRAADAGGRVEACGELPQLLEGVVGLGALVQPLRLDDLELAGVGQRFDRLAAAHGGAREHA